MAKEKNCTSAQLALAWVLAQREDIVPIPGTKKRKYLEENIAAVAINLSNNDLGRINEITTEFKIAGARYPERGMKTVNR